MLLAIDIGNTSIQFGVIEGKRIRQTLDIITSGSPQLLKKQAKAALRKILPKNKKCESVVICSVVPRAGKAIENILKKDFKLRPVLIGRDIVVPIRNRYKNPRQVGQDRLVGAYAASRLYGKPMVIVDLGTAITLDAISRKGDYLGGIIVPGIQLSADTLFQKAALLPKVKIQRPASLIGKDTQTSILSGIFYGYGEMLKGLINLISKKIGSKSKVVVTGGYSDIMRKYIKKDISKVDNHLVLKGLLMLWDEIE